MSDALHFVGVRMEAERAKALRILAARNGVSLAELVRRATEAQYGDEIDNEIDRSSAPTMVRTSNNRSLKAAQS